VSSAAAFLARVLQFMETPQYMRKCAPGRLAAWVGSGQPWAARMPSCCAPPASTCGVHALISRTQPTHELGRQDSRLCEAHRAACSHALLPSPAQPSCS